MAKYKHLKEKDRERLFEMRAEKRPMAACARTLGVNKSTVSRELKRNSAHVGFGVYLPDRAENLYRGRRKACRPHRKMNDPSLRREIVIMLQKGWSPELIEGRLRETHGHTIISHETLYAFIYASDIGKKHSLYEYLPRGKKRRSKKQGRRVHKNRLEGRVFLESRPREANERSVVGHWETDTLLCKYRKGINVLAERTSRVVVMTKLFSGDAASTRAAITSRLADVPCESVTGDNGPENAEHELVSQTLAVPFFFCHPYHSWEKGTVENRNGLIRRYLPRRTNLDLVSQEELDDIAADINNRPMKVLGFRTPNEVLLTDRCTWN